MSPFNQNPISEQQGYTPNGSAPPNAGVGVPNSDQARYNSVPDPNKSIPDHKAGIPNVEQTILGLQNILTLSALNIMRCDAMWADIQTLKSQISNISRMQTFNSAGQNQNPRIDKMFADQVEQSKSINDVKAELKKMSNEIEINKVMLEQLTTKEQGKGAKSEKKIKTGRRK